MGFSPCVQVLAQWLRSIFSTMALPLPVVQPIWVLLLQLEVRFLMRQRCLVPAYSEAGFAVASVCNGLCLVYGIFCLENRSNVSEKNSVKNQTDDGEKIH